MIISPSRETGAVRQDPAYTPSLAHFLPHPAGGGQYDRTMRRPLFLATLLLLGGLAPATAQTATPAETARAMLRQYQDDPARIDRARDLLEAHLARGGAADVPTLLALARAWFLFGEERAKTDDDKVAAYARARDYAKRAIELAPNDADAHLWHAITLGTWSQAKGLLRSTLALRDLRREVDIVLRLDPNNIEAHIMAGSIARELPVLLGGDAKEAEEHFKTAQRLDPKLTGVRIELAQLYINMGRYAEARQQLQSVLAERAPTDRPRWTLKEAPRARQMLESIRDKK
jgi:tetratricopeptide (TPR) repeat protein